MANQEIRRKPSGCYVYEVIVEGVVRYIGKGTGRRAWRHTEIAARNNRLRSVDQKVKATKWHNRLAKALAAGASVEVRIIAEGMTSEQAFQREVAEIASRPDGLWNYTGGGEGLDSDAARRLWADPGHRAAMVAKRQSEESRGRASEKAIAQHASPAAREALSKRSKALWQDPEFREKASAASRSRWADDAFRRRHREAATQAWELDPERRARRAEITKSYAGTPEFRDRASARFKGLWSDPEFREKATAHWRDAGRKAAIRAALTPEFLAARGRAISEGLRKSEKHRNRKRPSAGRVWTQSQREAHAEKMREIWADPVRRADQSRRRRGKSD
jgi:hypothetical protein